MKKSLILILALSLVFQPVFAFANPNYSTVNHSDTFLNSPMGEVPEGYVKWTPEIGKEDEKQAKINLNQLIQDIPIEVREEYFSELQKVSDGQLVISNQINNSPIVHLNIHENKFSTYSSKPSDLYEAKASIENIQSNIQTMEKVSTIQNKMDLNKLNTYTYYSTILSIFKAFRLPISYHFYTHYIGKSGQNLYFDLTGYKADLINRYDGVGIESNIKQGLYNHNFHAYVDKEMGSKGYGEKNEDGFRYEFSRNSDLGLAIHGTWDIRLHRVKYQKTYFRIYDIYDFEGFYKRATNLDQDFSPIHPKQAGVDYRIIIEGLQIGMTIQ